MFVKHKSGNGQVYEVLTTYPRYYLIVTRDQFGAPHVDVVEQTQYNIVVEEYII